MDAKILDQVSVSMVGNLKYEVFQNLTFEAYEGKVISTNFVPSIVIIQPIQSSSGYADIAIKPANGLNVYWSVSEWGINYITLTHNGSSNAQIVVYILG